MIRGIGFLAVLLLLAGPASGGINEALNAMNQGHYKYALNELLPLGMSGNSQAQHLIGTIHEKGEGVLRDYAEAAYWYRLAANDGWAPAQASLAAMYREGRGVPKDPKLSAEWVRRAADLGYAPSMVTMGNLHKEGDVLPRDYAKAERWYRGAIDAAEKTFDSQSVSFATLGIGNLYEQGRGRERDVVEAYKWYSIGVWMIARWSRETAVRTLNEVVRGDLANRMTADQLDRARGAAQKWIDDRQAK